MQRNSTQLYIQLYKFVTNYFTLSRRNSHKYTLKEQLTNLNQGFILYLNNLIIIPQVNYRRFNDTYRLQFKTIIINRKYSRSIIILPNSFHRSFKFHLNYYLIGYFILLDDFHWLSRFFSNPIFVFLGSISYGLYVYHGITLPLTWRVIPSSYPISIQMLFSFFSTILIAYISYKFMEKPIMLLKNKFQYS